MALSTKNCDENQGCDEDPCPAELKGSIGVPLSKRSLGDSLNYKMQYHLEQANKYRRKLIAFDKLNYSQKRAIEEILEGELYG